MLTSLVLDPRQFKLLEGLRLNPRKSFSGRIRGERLTAKKGISIEFADYREYAEGDDLRHLDWNVLARLEVPIIKTYRDEEDLAVHLIVDGSPSMEFGDPTKSFQAARMAAAIGFIALAGGDAVYPRLVGAREAPMHALRGRSSFPRLAGWAMVRERQVGNPLAKELRAFTQSSARLGVVLLISDGLDPEMPGAVRALGGRGHEILFLQILSPEELDPDLEGDLRLIDAEAGSPVEITANSYALKEYRRRLTEHTQAIRDAVLRVGGRHALIQPADEMAKVLKNVLKREGWVTG